eukprot:GSChrysophyteH1.ASY1.ANO1.2489.1 assembled CDS
MSTNGMRPDKKKPLCSASHVVTVVVIIALALMSGVLYSSHDVISGDVISLWGQDSSDTHEPKQSDVLKNAPNEPHHQPSKKFDGLFRNFDHDQEEESSDRTKEAHAKKELISFLSEEGLDKLPIHTLLGTTHGSIHKDRKEQVKSARYENNKNKDGNARKSTMSASAGTTDRRSKGKKPLEKKPKDKALHGTEPDAHDFHEWVSPRSGSAIDTPEQQLELLTCENQAKCVTPELQLTKKLRVYMCLHPARHGVRFYFLVKEGLVLHPNVELVTDYVEALRDPSEGGADYILYLPGSSPWHKTECTDSSQASKLIVMDEFDGPSLFFPYKTAEEVEAVYGKNMVWYDMYFKRSFVTRRDGKFYKHPHLNKLDIYPLTYAISESYLPHHFTMKRSIEIMCTLRGSERMKTRLRVQQWIQDYTQDPSKGVKNAIVEQINKATRSTVSKDYFDNMYNSQIIVTVNPANWEGDFRLWESLATGALIFVDPIFVPHPYTMIDGVHCIFFHNSNRTELFEKLDYYREHTEEARKIAIQGYLHALKYHRTVNLMDYVLRSAHLKSALVGQRDNVTNNGSPNEKLPEYTYTAQYLNHQAKEQEASILERNLPAITKATLGLHHDFHEPHSLKKNQDMPSSWH